MTRLRRMRALLLAALLAVSSVPSVAEVSAMRTGMGNRRSATLFMDLVTGITDGADPIPQIRWTPYRKIHPRQILNPSGAIRRDGRPDADFHPVAGSAFVTWAYNNGTDHDIAFSFWTGDTWTETEFLTSDAANHVDPRIALSPTGGVNVVWAVDGEDPRIMFSHRRAIDQAWTVPARVTGPRQTVASPTVTTVLDSIWVGYEELVQLDGEVRPMISVKELRSDATNLSEYHFPSHRLKFMEPILHVDNVRVWLDWRFSDDQFAWVILRGPDAGAIHLEPWLDRSWVGTENVRALIRGKVLAIPRTAAESAAADRLADH